MQVKQVALAQVIFMRGMHSTSAISCYVLAVMPGVKLQEHSGNDKAWVWSTVDFAGEQSQLAGGQLAAVVAFHCHPVNCYLTIQERSTAVS